MKAIIWGLEDSKLDSIFNTFKDSNNDSLDNRFNNSDDEY